MKRSHQAAGLLAALGLALAATVQANPGQHGGMGMHGKGAMQQGMHGKGAMQQGMQGMHGGGQQLMTPDERGAAMEKMRNAKTPEERQKIAEAHRTEMHKRAQEKDTPHSH